MRKLLFAALFLTAPAFLLAQAEFKEGDVLDKVAAVVGSEVIMKSEIDAQMAFLKQQDPSIKISDPGKRRQVLNLLINENLMIMKAIEDSVEVSDEEIEQRWQMQLQQYIQMYGSKERLENVYGRSIESLKLQFWELVRKKLLSEKLQMQKFGNININPREVEEFYNEYQDSIPPIPDKVSLYHIVKDVKPAGEEKEEILNLARRVRDSLLDGEDFEEFAQKYSGDVYSAKKGGSLGWVKKGRLYPEFEKAAFSLTKGQISTPVETPFGFHIIQTIDKQDESVNVRHILFKFGGQSENTEKAIEFLKSLKKQVQDGADFESLAREHSDDLESKGFGGAIAGIGKFSLPLTAMSMYPAKYTPTNLNEIIMELETGEITEPLPYEGGPEPSYRIIYKKSYTPGHRASLENDYDDIKQFAKRFKQSRLQEEWIAELREEMYWEIKD